MKKHLLFPSGLILVGLLSTTCISAQITITQANMPMVGTKALMEVDTTGTLAPQSASATSQTWNYSALASQETYAYLFEAPSATPYFGSFPSSNLADSLAFGNGYTYNFSSPTAFSQMGFGEEIYGYRLAISSRPLFTQITFPATYGTTDGGVCKGDTAIAFTYLLYDSARGTVQITYSDTIDAFGVMTTPFGTDTVIRQKHYDKTVDSAFVRTTLGHWSLYQATATTDYQYRWYSKDVPYYFAVMQMNNANTQDSLVQWYDGNTVGIDPISHSAFTKVYPNPCHTEITFTCSSTDARQIAVFDVTGRQISTQEITNGMLNVNTSAYSSGMYFYQVLNASGNILDRGKFIVQ